MKVPHMLQCPDKGSFGIIGRMLLLLIGGTMLTGKSIKNDNGTTKHDIIDSVSVSSIGIGTLVEWNSVNAKSALMNVCAIDGYAQYMIRDKNVIQKISNAVNDAQCVDDKYELNSYNSILILYRAEHVDTIWLDWLFMENQKQYFKTPPELITVIDSIDCENMRPVEAVPLF